jgi:hypothetical protein
MFCKPDGTITVRSFDAIIRVSDGEALVSPTDYEVVFTPVNVAAKVVSRFVIEATEEHTALNVGDELVVIYDGFTSLNTVNKVGEGNDRYELSEKLPVTTADTVLEFRSEKETVEFKGITEGFYYIQYGDRGNEQLIIRNTWMKPYIGYQELTASFSDAKTIEDGRIKMLNEQAWEEIYCDLSAWGNAYDLLYGGEIRTLQKYKILSILENDFERRDEATSFREIYKTYLNKVSAESLKQLEEDQNGLPTGEIVQLTMDFSL